MGSRANDLLPVQGWYPTGADLRQRVGTALYLNPKLLIPQCFDSPSGLAEVCVLRSHLPGWVLDRKEAGSFPSEVLVAPELTCELLFVRVTPRVWAWSRLVGRMSELKGSKLLSFQREVLDLILPEYCRNVFPASELRHAETLASNHKGLLGELLPQPDSIWLDLVRFGLASPWYGFEQWAAKQPVPEVPPDPSAQPERKPTPSRSTKSSALELF